MKLIHTADLHLDSPLISASNPSARRLELLRALFNLSEYANNNGVEGIIVAGDLFDDKFTTEKTIQGVADIVNQSNATWFVLRGNHGDATPYQKLSKLCQQIKFFGESWTTYNLGDVAICGRELGQNDQAEWASLQLDGSKFNVLVLHGDVDDESYGFIDKKAIAGSGASYVALGHRHGFAVHKMGKVNCVYSGVLEPRGFDERDQTGFVVVDTQANSINFVKQAIRSVQNVTVDLTNIQSEIALEQALLQAVADVSPRNYLNVTLAGQALPQLNLQIALQALQGRFFALRVDNKTQTQWDIDVIGKELSLRGEFVRQALQISDESTRNEVLKMGLTALCGGELQ